MFPVGSRVRIDSVSTWAHDRPAEDQARLKALIGETRTVVEMDRYGCAWLSWDPDGTSADFCLTVPELTFVAPPPVVQSTDPRDLPKWSRLRLIRASFGPSTAFVLFALAGCIAVGLIARMSERAATRDDTAVPRAVITLAWGFPMLTLLAGTALAGFWWYRKRSPQYLAELAVCAILWIVLAVVPRI